MPFKCQLVIRINEKIRNDMKTTMARNESKKEIKHVDVIHPVYNRCVVHTLACRAASEEEKHAVKQALKVRKRNSPLHSLLSVLSLVLRSPPSHSMDLLRVYSSYFPWFLML